jgi:hypothetical protein
MLGQWLTMTIRAAIALALARVLWQMGQIRIVFHSKMRGTCRQIAHFVRT